ncbi:MAG: PstS family phosphate ABC transporter substrate-binding protein [Mycoplasma sp.]
MSLIKSTKVKKWLIAGISIVSIVTPITLLSINWTNPQILYASGSSAVFPVLEKLSSTYLNTYQKLGLTDHIEISVESTGSGTGLSSAASGTKHLGNISYGPDKSKIKSGGDIDILKGWTEREIKTLTLGIDGIGVIYKGNFNLDINVDNVVNLYSAMAGFNEYSYADLGVSGVGSDLKIIPYARTGGAKASGTTDAFLKDSGLKMDKENPLYKPAYDALNSGNYGPKTTGTKESNIETWHQVSSNGGINGAITYLSAGFILNNKKIIEDAGFRIATYSDITLSSDVITKGYNWYRPLNTLFSTKEDNPTIKSWVNWFTKNYHSEPAIGKALEDLGIVPLTEEQLETMANPELAAKWFHPETGKDPVFDENLFWYSDFEQKPYDEANDKYKWGAQT